MGLKLEQGKVPACDEWLSVASGHLLKGSDPAVPLVLFPPGLERGPFDTLPLLISNEKTTKTIRAAS